MCISLNKKFLSNSNEVLKEILNKRENLNISKKFIEDMIGIKIKKIFLREDLKPEIEAKFPECDYGIATFRIITEDDMEFNVGIQIVDGFYVQDKLIIYASSIHVKQSEYETHNQVVKTITINFVDDKVFPSPPEYRKVMNLIATDGEHCWNKGLDIHIIELPKFEIKEIEINEQAWLAYIKADNERLVEIAKERCMEIKQLDEELNKYWTNEQL